MVHNRELNQLENLFQTNPKKLKEKLLITNTSSPKKENDSSIINVMNCNTASPLSLRVPNETYLKPQRCPNLDQSEPQECPNLNQLEPHECANLGQLEPHQDPDLVQLEQHEHPGLEISLTKLKTN